MSDDLFKYRAIAEVQKGKLSYVRNSSENFEGEVELFNNPDEHYKIFATFNNESNLAILRSLIVEKVFQVEQDSNEFRLESEKLINIYFNRLKFIHKKYSSVIGSPDTIVKPDGQIDCYVSGGIVVGGSVDIGRYSLHQDCDQLNQVNDALWDECIERYNMVVEFPDPVLRLISLYSIVELIKDVRADLPEDSLIFAARNLVAHGIVDQRKTVGPLRGELGQADQFKFSRHNGQQMELVRNSADRLAGILAQYLTDQLAR